MNRFAYAEANPWTFSDPSGHATCFSTSDLCDEQMAIQHQGTQAGKAAARRTANQDTGVRHRRAQRNLTVPKRAYEGDVPTTPGCSSSICNRGAPDTAKENSLEPCSAAKLNCGLAEIQQMTMAERSAWMHQLAQVTGGNEWLNALIGVVDAGGATGHDRDSWFGTVDARILSSLQAGYLSYRSGGTGDTDDAVKAWGSAWKDILSNSAASNDDQVNAAIAAAEDASIKLGRGDAKGLGRSPDRGEWMTLVGSNTFRLGQSNRSGVSAAAQFVCAGAAPCGPIAIATGFNPGSAVAGLFDERNYTLANTAAFGFFSQAGNAQLPPVEALDPFFPPQ